jgi:hypothetical protein
MQRVVVVRLRVVAAFVFGALLLRGADAVPLLVYNTNDAGAGSLRQAITDNKNLGGGNTIVFSNTVNGAILLTTGELLISNNVTILGPGANVLAVSGNGVSRVFHITNSVVTLAGLTLSNGLAAGLAYPFNSGGGVYNGSSVLTLSNCTLSGNAATYGGGIFNDGALPGSSATLIVIACTLSGNFATNSGGGIYNAGGNQALTTISNSTLYGNTAGYGGCIFNDGAASTLGATLTVIASTLSSNSASATGGGIYNEGEHLGKATVEIGNTILRTGTSGANIANLLGTILSDGYNLSSDNAGGLLTSVTDQINTDPLLGPLRDNGGPTQTMAPLANSPAIDKGRSLGLTTDQRGAPRPYDFPAAANASGGDGCDIGAFESGKPTLNIQKFSTNAVLSWPSYYGDFTLQSLTNIIASNSWASMAGTPGVVGNQYVLTNGPVAGNKYFRLKGN